MKPKLLFVSLLLATLAMSACAIPQQYSAAPIEAWVVDAATSQPIEGVIVVAHWELLGGLEGNTPVGQMMVMESVTDQAGRFSFPAWGPKWEFGWGSLGDSDPELLFFKSGYKYESVSNSRFSWPEKRADRTLPNTKSWVGGSKRISLWNGEKIKMEKFRGSLEEYARHVSSFSGNLRFVGDNCQWKIVPRMILELQKQLDVFKAAGIVTGFYSVDYLPMNKEDEAKCGSPKEFFKEYQK